MKTSMPPYLAGNAQRHPIQTRTWEKTHTSRHTHGLDSRGEEQSDEGLRSGRVAYRRWRHWRKRAHFTAQWRVTAVSGRNQELPCRVVIIISGRVHLVPPPLLSPIRPLSLVELFRRPTSTTFTSHRPTSTMSVAAIRGARQVRSAGLRVLRSTSAMRAYHGPKTVQELEHGQSDAVSLPFLPRLTDDRTLC